MEIRKYFNKADKIEEAKAYNKSLSLMRSKIVEEKEDEEYDPNKFWVINSSDQKIGIPNAIPWKETNLKDESEEYSKKWTLIGCFNCNNLRQCVSLKKKRLRRDNFDLDLTYITKNVIAMGYPADGFESVYRNNQRSVSNFLLDSHYLKEERDNPKIFKVKI